MMAPAVLRKGLPRIIGHVALHSISKTTKSTGTRLLLTFIRILLTLPKGFWQQHQQDEHPNNIFLMVASQAYHKFF